MPSIVPVQLELPGMKTPKEVFRQLRNYLAGQFIGATRDETLLDELLKCLFCKLYVELGLAETPSFADVIIHAQQIRRIFARVRNDFPDIYSGDSELLLDPESIAAVFHECRFTLLDSASDPIGDAFEVFAGSESRGRSGQFFTPRQTTDFLVEALVPEVGERVIDPACGAGGFLTSVIRLHHRAGVSAEDVGANVNRNLFGIDKDSYLVNLARIHGALLSGGHPNISCADSISMMSENRDADALVSIRDGTFDVVLTNPPFGTRIIAAQPDVLRRFILARKWRTCQHSDSELEPTAELRQRVPPQVLFVERCVSLLRPGGRLGMVVPESLLSNKSYRHVVEFLRQQTRLEGIIGMPDELFKTSGKGGTHTKTCLLIAHKTDKPSRKRIFMAEARWCGQDSRARSISKNDLPEVLDRFIQYRSGNSLSPSPLGFTVAVRSLNGVLCPRYYDPGVDRELEALNSTHEMLVFGDLVRAGDISLRTGDEVGKLAYGTGPIPFIRTSDISNWELKADPKHGLSRELYESLRQKQDVRPLDLLLVRDGTYLVGTCAIITEYDTEIVYQSHIFKIRVTSSDARLDPFLLLAVLGSSIVQKQIKAKRFTQDIIDSLGDRIHELILPIPKDEAIRRRVTEMVRKAVYERVEAREISRKARLLVIGRGVDHAISSAS